MAWQEGKTVSRQWTAPQRDHRSSPWRRSCTISMMPYAEYVILERALPRVEDGLKPVQRRILYTMHELGIYRRTSRTASAPASSAIAWVNTIPMAIPRVYDALVRMAQAFQHARACWWTATATSAPSTATAAAAMRYTEARMTPLALEMLRDIDKDTVPLPPQL